MGTFVVPLIHTNGSLSKLSIVIDIELVQGRLSLIISSKVKLMNNTEWKLTILVNDALWPEPVELGSVNPQESLYIPVSCAVASELRIKPPAEYAWSAPIPLNTGSMTAGPCKVRFKNSKYIYYSPILMRMY